MKGTAWILDMLLPACCTVVRQSMSEVFEECMYYAVL